MGVNIGDAKNEVLHAIYQNQKSSKKMTTRGELITAIKHPLPETAGRCHLFIHFAQNPKIYIFCVFETCDIFF